MSYVAANFVEELTIRDLARTGVSRRQTTVSEL